MRLCKTPGLADLIKRNSITGRQFTTQDPSQICSCRCLQPLQMELEGLEVFYTRGWLMIILHLIGLRYRAEACSLPS